MKSAYSKILVVCMLTAALAGCVLEDRFVEGEGELMLQVDAVLTEGQPLDEIKVRQTFVVTRGGEPFFQDTDELWVENAQITLRKENDETGEVESIDVTAYQNLPGRYRVADPAYRIQENHTYIIEVAWNDLFVSAHARVPDYDINQLQKEYSTVKVPGYVVFERESTDIGPPILDTLEVYRTEMHFEQSIPYNMAALQVASYSAIQAAGMYLQYQYTFRNPLDYIPHYLEERDYQLESSQNVYGFYPLNSNDTDREPKGIRMVMLVPESIYGDYALLNSNYLVPAVVTNVEGGVGLFVGAKRDTTEIFVNVSDITQ